MNSEPSRLYLNFSTSLLYFKNIWKLQWLFILGLISFLISMPAAFTFESIPSALISIFGFLISSTSILIESKKRKSIDQKHLLVKSTVLKKPNLTLDSVLLRNGFQIFGNGSSATIQSKELNAYLANGGRIEVEQKTQYWTSSEDIPQEWRSKLLSDARNEKRILFNSKKVRLINEPLLTGSAIPKVKIQPTFYLEGFWTNEAANFDLKNESRTVFSGSSFYLDSDTVMSLERSQCANLIGISTLLIGQNSRLPLVRQSHRSAVSKALIAPSGSGSMDIEDFQEAETDFNQVICRAAERELREEMGISPEVRVCSQVIGFTRTLGRGGKPEFFCVTWVESDLNSIGLSRAERLFTHHADSLSLDWGMSFEEMAEELKKYVAQHEETYSQSLCDAIYLLIDALSTASPNAPFKKAISQIR